MPAIFLNIGKILIFFFKFEIRLYGVPPSNRGDYKSEEYGTNTNTNILLFFKTNTNTNRNIRITNIFTNIWYSNTHLWKGMI